MDSPVSHEPAIQRLENYIDAPPERYLDEFLAETISVTNAEAAQVWGLSDDGRLVKICGVSSPQLRSLDKPEVVQKHRDLLSRTLFDGNRQTNPLQFSGGQSEAAKMLTMAPLHLDQEAVGVLEMILPSQLNETQNQSLDELLSHASCYLAKSAMQKSGDAPNASAHQQVSPISQATPEDKSERLSASELELFIWSLHQHDDWKSTSSAIVNETRRLLGCDRVSLAIRNGGKSRITAVSGQDSVVRRSNSVRAIQKIADQVFRSGQRVDFEIGDSSPANQPAGFTLDYLQETEALGFAAIPLLPPSKPEFDQVDSAEADQPFAVLFVEQFSDNPDFSSNLPRLVPHLSQAAFHSLQQSQIFLRPTRQMIGRMLQHSKIGATKALLICGSMLLFLAVMFFWKSTYSIKAVGKLMPAEQFRAYAPFDGEVQNVWVSSGQIVERDQPLLNLYDERLATQHLTLQNELAQKKKTLSAHNAQMDQSQTPMTMSERIELNAKIAQTQSEIDGLMLRLESSQRLLQKAEMRSEIPGRLATFRPDDLLSGRPVARGDLLVEVMNEDGPWILELQIPAKRYGHLMQEYQTNQSARPATFVLATDPERTYEATIQEVSSRASDDGQGGAVFQLRAKITDDEHSPRTIGADVTASIDCGQQPLGYVLFGDIIDWVQMRIW